MLNGTNEKKQARSPRLAGAMLLASLFIGGVAQALDNPVVIDDFPQYGVGLSTAQKDVLRSLALNAAMVLMEGRRVEILVEGHADKDAQGRSFEMDVSLKRAQRGSDDVLLLIREALIAYGSNPRLADTVSIALSGAGNTFPKVRAPTSEAERKKNRRVEFRWTFGPPAL